MNEYFDPETGRMTYEIIAGEYFSTTDKNAVLTTLLGSCVSVCLSDNTNGVFGMNHFMMPNTPATAMGKKDPRFGTCAVELLIDNMMRMGASRERLEAKVFGAGRMLELATFDIHAQNAEFIKKYLQVLKIPIVASDLGKDYGRRIMFYCDSGEVLVRKISEMDGGPGWIK